MAQETPTPADTDQQAPPEERFWKRYSPHHEFPLSSVGSVLLHILSIGALVVIGYVITRTRPDEQLAPPTIDVVAAPGLPTRAGGGGSPDGRDNAPGGAQSKGETEIAANDNPPQPKPGNVATENPEQLKSFELQPIEVKDEGGTRTIVGENKKVLGDLNRVLDQAKQNLAQSIARADAAKGRGGSSKGGGKGSGEGPGEGADKGPGVQKGGTIRQQRQARWKMFFATTGGADYLRQLKGLGAYLGVPRIKGENHIEYGLIRDIRPNPAIKVEDVSKLNRIFWFDHETRSVMGMAQALRLPHAPPYFVAFFPPELEKRLRELEQQAYSGDENRIVETHFRVVNRGGVYDVELDPKNPIVLKR
jgi:hypothetical protein